MAQSSSSSSSSSSSATAITEQTKTSFREAAAGFLASTFSKAATAPLDRIKLVVQLQSTISPTSKESSNATEAIVGKAGRDGAARLSTFEITKNIYQKEGLLSFWRGGTATMAIQGGNTALNFVFLDLYKKVGAKVVTYASGTSDPTVHRERKWRLRKSFASGALAGLTSIAVLYPLGLARTKLAADMGKDTTAGKTAKGSSSSSSSRLYPRGMRDVFGRTYRLDGIQGLYRGFGVAVWSVTLYRMVYLGGFDFAKTEALELHHRRRRRGHEQLTYESKQMTYSIKKPSIDQEDVVWNKLPFWQRFAVAQIVSATASLSHYPLDSVRRRMMMQAGRSIEERQYASAFDCARKVWHGEGISGFYLGIGPNLVRSFGAALLLVTYDGLKKYVL